MSNLLKRLKAKFSHIKLGFLDGARVSYGVLHPCYRCRYAKSREAIVIVSGGGYGKRQGKVLMIVNYKKRTYSRHGDCLGFKECGKCIEKVDNKDLKTPCRFNDIGGI